MNCHPLRLTTHEYATVFPLPSAIGERARLRLLAAKGRARKRFGRLPGIVKTRAR